MDVTLPIPLERDTNVIEVVAFNGVAETRRRVTVAVLEEQGQQAASASLLPNLWIFAIGVNEYQDPKVPDLSYAAADAAGLVEAFRSQEGRLFKEVNALVISDDAELQPTFENILDHLDYLSRASHRDVVLLFIAGHGVNDSRGDFYFLPSDASIEKDGSVKRSRAISWRDLRAVLDLPAKKIVFADTCYSAGISGKKTRSVDNDRLVKELQEANAVIFTSSTGTELSQEDEKAGHGVFTQALIQGLGGQADLVKDRKISMKELDAYVSETVPRKTRGAQHPITQTPDGYINFPIALVR